MPRDAIDPSGTACNGKEPFASGAFAARAARNMGRFGKNVEVYRCPACHKWHIGRGSKSRKHKFK